MALQFAGGAATDRVNFGSDASLDNLSEITVKVWIKWDAFSANDRLWNKGVDNAGVVALLNFQLGSDEIRFKRDRATSNTIAVQTSVNYAVDTWYCIFCTGHPTNLPRVYFGTLSTILGESSYSTQTAGSGAISDESASSFLVGNRDELDACMDGTIAFVQIWNTQLSLAECQRHQFHPTVDANTVLHTHLGYNGTGTQADWSGNGNAGTVTGATQTDHVPLGPFFGADFDFSPLRVVSSSNPLLLIQRSFG